MPLLFLYVSQDACAKVRRQLKMVNNQSFFLEVQSPDETQKRITILPEKLTEENKAVLKQHFESKLQELESKDANKILVRSSPKNIAMLKAKMVGADNMQGGSKNTATAEQAVVKYCRYPSDSPGNVSITNEDNIVKREPQDIKEEPEDIKAEYVEPFIKEEPQDIKRDDMYQFVKTEPTDLKTENMEEPGYVKAEYEEKMFKAENFKEEELKNEYGEGEMNIL